MQLNAARPQGQGLRCVAMTDNPIDVTLGGCCDQRAIDADENLHRHAVENPNRAEALSFVVQPRLAGHGPRLFAGLSKHVAPKLVSRLEFASGAVAMRYEPGGQHATRLSGAPMQNV